ncbi:MAG: metallophosphoesterase [Candidatus Aadella gelida]|nr:metallophosphoesterase [Candidatus Aadella gelida]
MKNKLIVISRYIVFSVFLAVLLCANNMCLAETPDEVEISFVFVGHIRGPENFTINSLLPYFVKDVKEVKSDLVLLGGDSICGYVTSYDEAGLEKEWDMVDEYLNQIGVPIYRVTGNHDLHSNVTKMVFNRRYGPEYYSFVKNDVMFIALNSTKLCPDETLDWGNIWKSGAHLPNEAELPSGEQLKFLKNSLKEANRDMKINNIVIFMGGLLWGMPETKDKWWSEIHPMLVSSGKVKLLISGEAGNDSEDSYLKKDDIVYLRNGWGITSEKDFSLRGTYLQIIFQKGEKTPEVYTRFINLTPEYYQSLMGALSDDTENQLIGKAKLSRGEGISSLNKVRMIARDWIDSNVRLYNRQNNIHMALTLLGIGLVLLVLTVKAFVGGRR